MSTKYKDVIDKLFRDINVKDPHVLSMVERHLDALCYNIASILNVFATLHGKKITDETISDVHRFLSKKCSKSTQHGGTVMASDFFGYNHSSYSAQNANVGATVTGTVNFADGIQRAGLGPQTGGSVATKDIRKKIKVVLSRNEIKCSSTHIDAAIQIVYSQLECLKTSLKKVEPVTVKKLETIFKQKRYALFN